MTVPIVVRIGALVFATTAFYGYVGQMVPQKEVQPPQEIALAADMTTADMVNVGREIVNGKGMRMLPRVIPPDATRRLAFWEYYSLVGRSPERHSTSIRG